MHPVWNETFTVPVTDDQLSLTLILEDWDQVGSNDFMGRVLVPLAELKNRKVKQRWFALGGPNDEDLPVEEIDEEILLSQNLLIRIVARLNSLSNGGITRSLIPVFYW